MYLVNTHAGSREGPGLVFVNHFLPGALPGYFIVVGGGSDQRPVGCIYSFTRLFPRVQVSLPVSFRCRFNWAMKLLEEKMRNYPVSPGRQWAGPPELRWPNLTPHGWAQRRLGALGQRQAPWAPTEEAVRIQTQPSLVSLCLRGTGPT